MIGLLYEAQSDQNLDERNSPSSPRARFPWLDHGGSCSLDGDVSETLPLNVAVSMDFYGIRRTSSVTARPSQFNEIIVSNMCR